MSTTMAPFHDVPAKFLMREMARDYAHMQGEDLSGRDMEREAASDVQSGARGVESGADRCDAIADASDEIRSHINRITAA